MHDGCRERGAGRLQAEARPGSEQSATCSGDGAKPRLPALVPSAPARVVARSKGALVFLRREEVWAFEAVNRLSFVHSSEGRFDVDLGLGAFEASLGRPFVRVHRSWLVNLDWVKGLEGRGGDVALSVGAASPSERIRVPVSRQHARSVRALLLREAIGIRHG